MSFVALGVFFPIKIALAGWLVFPQEPAPAASPPQVRKPIEDLEWLEFPSLCERRPSWLRSVLSNAEVIFVSPIAIRFPKDREVFPCQFEEPPGIWWARPTTEPELLSNSIDLLNPQTLRGALPPNLEIPLAVNSHSSRQSATREGWLKQPHLFFLWPDGDGWRSSKVAPNGIPVNAIEQAAYVDAIKSWESLTALEQGSDMSFAAPWTPAKHAELVRVAMGEWLVKLARNPTTRGYAADELYPLRCHRTQHEAVEVCVTVQDLTPDQVDELIQILADCETPGARELKLYEALRDSSDHRLVDFLLQYLSSINLETKDPGVLGALAYDLITRAANEEAMTVFRECWSGGIGSWKFESRIYLPDTAVKRILSLIRSQLEC